MVTSSSQFDDEFNADRETSNALEYLRKESLDIYNRLHSISEDAAFVAQVRQVYPDIPLLPNLRCGAWYSNPLIAADVPAYFKSTDGHFSNWSFNLRRANLHLIPVIAAHNGAILVDSTRSGKRIPDALSKTVPIWCAVVNRAVALRHPREGEWDTALYTPPGAVSSQEHHQIELRIDAWAEALFNSSFDLPNLPYPLRPLWITPATTTFPTLRSTPAFLPVVCVSASKQIHLGAERRSVGFSYIQGSGDDHELWSMGLTPRMFWAHRDALLQATRARLPELIAALVDAEPAEGTNGVAPSPITKIGGRLLVCTLADLTGVNIDGPDGDAYVLIGPESSDEDLGPNAPNAGAAPRNALRIALAPGKKGQTQFRQSVLPASMSFIGAQLAGGKRVCVACETGRDASAGVALTAMQLFFDDEGKLVCGEERTRKATADKKSIRTRLEWIIASRPAVNPSRTTLKRVNEFLLSPSAIVASS